MYDEPPQSNQTQPPQNPIKRLIIIGLAITFGFVVLISMWFCRVPPKMSNANTGYPVRHAPSEQLPEFPWPPHASAFMNIPSQYVANPHGATTLRDVSLRLESALRRSGYGQIGYYSIPRGFALTTGLEQFKPDGSPADASYRWSLVIPNPRVFSIDYLRTLLAGKAGHYRVIVFAVSDDEFFSQHEGHTVDVEEANKLAIEGANRLPDWLGDTAYTDHHWCAALIYEFEKPSIDQPIDFKRNSSLTAEEHLQKILPYLENHP